MTINSSRHRTRRRLPPALQWAVKVLRRAELSPRLLLDRLRPLFGQPRRFQRHQVEIEDQRLVFWAPPGCTGYHLVRLRGRWWVYGPAYSPREMRGNFTRLLHEYPRIDHSNDIFPVWLRPVRPAPRGPASDAPDAAAASRASTETPSMRTSQSNSGSASNA